MAKDPLLEGLNDALNREISTILRSMLQGSIIRGRQNQSLRQMYRAEVTDEIGHARLLADKIVMLGGVPVLRPELSPPPADVERMIDKDLAKEEPDVAHYKNLAELADERGDIDLSLPGS